MTLSSTEYFITNYSASIVNEDYLASIDARTPFIRCYETSKDGRTPFFLCDETSEDIWTPFFRCSIGDLTEKEVESVTEAVFGFHAKPTDAGILIYLANDDCLILQSVNEISLDLHKERGWHASLRLAFENCALEHVNWNNDMYEGDGNMVKRMIDIMMCYQSRAEAARRDRFGEVPVLNFVKPEVARLFYYIESTTIEKAINSRAARITRDIAKLEAEKKELEAEKEALEPRLEREHQKIRELQKREFRIIAQPSVEPDNESGPSDEQTSDEQQETVVEEEEDIADIVDRTKGRWVSQEEYQNRTGYKKSTLNSYREIGKGAVFSTKNPMIGMDTSGNFFKKVNNKPNSPYEYYLKDIQVSTDDE